MAPPNPAFDRHREAVRLRLASHGGRRSGPDSITWKVNREIVVVAGWGRAILLQMAHPLVAAGIADHSSFRGSLGSSLGRLRSTVGAMLSLTFGSDDEAIAAAAGINRIHDRVAGRIPEQMGHYDRGHEYSAHDPELLRWVHATLLDSIPLTYELLVGPLTAEERDRYCAEAAVIEPLLDIPHGLLPRNRAQLDAYMRATLDGGAVAVSDSSRALARAVLFPPRSFVIWPALRPVRLITIGLLPPAVREAYGFAWRPSDARALARWTTALRCLHRASPKFVREWPASRREPVVATAPDHRLASNQ
jgi:uncharacterized protein (DUF2236 family)